MNSPNKNNSLYPCLQAIGKKFEKEFYLISTERKEQLKTLSHYLSQKFKAQQTPQAIVICTHNSRRSHLGQLWLMVGAAYFQLPEIQSFSGGTEATAFNSRAVKALQEIGFQIHAPEENSSNPIYHIHWKEGMEAYKAFSKEYTASPNPQKNFAALMVCTAASEACPVVEGADFVLSLPYNDPKSYDGTSEEALQYKETAFLIGRELFFALSHISI